MSGILGADSYVPLTPNMHVSFETHDPDRHIWNASTLLEVDQRLQPEFLEQALHELIVHYDALRLYSVQENNIWRQFIAPPPKVTPFSYTNLSAVPLSEHKSAIESKIADLQKSLNVSEGPLIRVALIDLGEHISSRLFIVVHHTVCDIVSFYILLEDFFEAYLQLEQGKEIQFPPETTPYAEYAKRLLGYAQTEDVKRTAPYWISLFRDGRCLLPVDNGQGVPIGASYRSLSMSLDVQEMGKLFHKIHARYQARIDDLLLTALILCFSRWTGEKNLIVEQTRHGRDLPLEGIDLTRTVGWLNTFFPVRLELVKGAELKEVFCSIRDQVKSGPHQGSSYGALRYLCQDPDIAEQFRVLPQPGILFIYRGRVATNVFPSRFAYRTAKESLGQTVSSTVIKPRLLYILSHTTDSGFHVTWEYSENVHAEATIHALNQQYKEILRDLIASL